MRRSFTPLIAAGSGLFSTSSVLLIAAFITNLDGWPWGDIMPRTAGSLVSIAFGSICVSVARRRMRRASAAGRRDARSANARFLGATLLGTFLGPLGGVAVAILLILVPPSNPGAGVAALVGAPLLGMALPPTVAALVGLIPRGVRVVAGATRGDGGVEAFRDDPARSDGGAIVMPASSEREVVGRRARRGAVIGALTTPITAGLALVSTASTLRADSLLWAALPLSLVGAFLVGISRQILIARLRKDLDGGLVSAIASGAALIALAAIVLASTAAGGADAQHITEVGPFRLVSGLPVIVEAFLVAGLGGAAVGLVVGAAAGAAAAAFLARRR